MVLSNDSHRFGSVFELQGIFPIFNAFSGSPPPLICHMNAGGLSVFGFVSVGVLKAGQALLFQVEGHK